MTDQETYAPTVLFEEGFGATVTPTEAPPDEARREGIKLDRSMPSVGWSEPGYPLHENVSLPADAEHKDGSGWARPVKGGSRRTEFVGLAITVGSLLLVMFLLYLYLFSALTGARNQNRLLHSLTGNPKAVYGLATGRQAPNGQPVAVLDIPSLGLHQAVVEGTTASDLQLGPGLASGTSLPGELGNAVIAGRRVSFGGAFGGIGRLKPGDEIKVIDGAGNFVFSVTSVETISKAQVSAPQYDRSWLTLVTSDSSWLPAGKLIVIARMTSGPIPSGTSSSGSEFPRTLYSLPSFAGDPAAGIPAVLWTLAMLALLAFMILSIRRWRQPLVSWLLAAPVLLACALFACENLARCLPSTL